MENCNGSPAGSCLYELITAASRRVQNSSAEEKEEGKEAKCKHPDVPVGCRWWEAGGIPGTISASRLATHTEVE